jgi:hypothetical protein
MSGRLYPDWESFNRAQTYRDAAWQPEPSRTECHKCGEPLHGQHAADEWEWLDGPLCPEHRQEKEAQHD